MVSTIPQAPTLLNPSPNPKEDLLNFLLNYAQQIQSLPLATLGQEVQLVWQHFRAEDLPKNRLQLVLLQGFSQATYRNDKLALELLDAYLQKADVSNPPLLAYLRFLQKILVERMETEKRVELRFKQERKERLELLEQRTKLQQKLEALKNIERSLNDRGKPAGLDKP